MINLELIDSACNRIFLYRQRYWFLSIYYIHEHFGAGGYRNPIPNKKVYFRAKSAYRHFNDNKQMWTDLAKRWPAKSEEENCEFYNQFTKI